MTIGASRTGTSQLRAALHVPDFPVTVLRRAQDGNAPAVVACGRPPKRFVYCADASARQHGVREGMALAAARARCSIAGARSALLVLERDEVAEQRAQTELLELAQAATPRFEDVGPGLLALDFSGLRAPYSAAEELLAGASRLGLRASVGVSESHFVSLCAARTRGGITHVYPGQEAGFLRSLSLDMLPLDTQEVRTLARWGVRTMGDLAQLPQAEMVERFGGHMVRICRLARGEADLALKPCPHPERLELSEDFDWEVTGLEPLAVAMAGLLERLCLKLHGLGQVVRRLTTQLGLVGGGTCERSIDLAQPLGDARALLELARSDLAARPPGGAVESVRMSVKPTKRRHVQLSLFAVDLPSPERLAVTLARLTGLVGAERLGAPDVPDTYRSGVAALAAFRPGSEAEAKRRAGRGPCAVGPLPVGLGTRRASRPPGVARRPLVLRCFRPSRPARVTLAADRPAGVEARDVRGKVTACAGPWRVSGEWWTSDGWQYQEWDIEVAGHLYRACCQPASGEWFLAGEYD